MADAQAGNTVEFKVQVYQNNEHLKVAGSLARSQFGVAKKTLGLHDKALKVLVVQGKTSDINKRLERQDLGSLLLRIGVRNTRSNSNNNKPSDDPNANSSGNNNDANNNTGSNSSSNQPDVVTNGANGGESTDAMNGVTSLVQTERQDPRKDTGITTANINNNNSNSNNMSDEGVMPYMPTSDDSDDSDDSDATDDDSDEESLVDNRDVPSEDDNIIEPSTTDDDHAAELIRLSLDASVHR